MSQLTYLFWIVVYVVGVILALRQTLLKDMWFWVLVSSPFFLGKFLLLYLQNYSRWESEYEDRRLKYRLEHQPPPPPPAAPPKPKVNIVADLSTEQYFVHHLFEQYKKRNPTPLNAAYFKQLVQLFLKIYHTDVQTHGNDARNLYLAACVDALTALTSQIDYQFLEQPHIPALLTVRYNLGDLSVGEDFDQAFSAFGQIFRDRRDDFKTLGMFRATELMYPTAHLYRPKWRDYDSDDSKQNQRQYDRDRRDYEKQADKAWNEMDPRFRPLVGTPFYLDALQALATTTAERPLDIPTKTRLEHTVIVAGSGHGKTQTFEHMLAYDLSQPDPPSLVVVDSKGQTPDAMLSRLMHLDLFHPEHGALKDRLLIIDPRDRPALNLFDLGVNVDSLDEDTRREQVNSAIDQLSYIFNSILGAEFSALMGTVFYPLFQLMIRVPGANLHTMIAALRKPEQYADEFENLPLGVRNILENKFANVASQTKNAVTARLETLTVTPAFEGIFDAPKNAINFTQALEQRKIILINADENYLHGAYTLFGRFFIAAIMRAVRMRKKRHPTFLYIDEAGPFFDETTEALLDRMRSYELGAVLAFQRFEQASLNLQGAIRANTSIKLVGGGNDQTAGIFAANIGCKPEFIIGQKKDSHEPPRFTDYAAYVRGLTDQAVSIRVPFGTLDTLPRMDEEAYLRMRAKNRRLVTRHADMPPPKPPAVQKPRQTWGE